MECKVDFVIVVLISVNVVWFNKVFMFIWGVIIFIIVVIGYVIGFIGFIVLMFIIGYVLWYVYIDVIEIKCECKYE